MTRFEELGNAVIMQAAKDYRDAVKKLKKKPKDPVAEKEIREISGFFRSQWFTVLSEANGERILELLEKEAA